MQLKRKHLNLLISVVLIFGLCFKLDLSWGSLYEGVKDWVFVFGAIFLSFAIVPLIAINRWKYFLGLVGIKERFFSLWKIALVSLFEGLILPSTQGSDAIKILHLSKRHTGCAGKVAGTIVVVRMLGVQLFCCVAIIGLPFVLRFANPKMPIVIGVVGFASAVVLGTMLAVNKKIYNLYGGKRPKMKILSHVVAFLDSTHQTLVSFPYRRAALTSVVLILLFQLSTILSVYLIFRAYGINLPFFMHMAFYPVIAIIAMMPVTIGGFGVREGAFAYFYSLVGVPAEVSVCVSVANYVVLSLLPASLGGVIWLWELAFVRKGQN